MRDFLEAYWWGVILVALLVALIVFAGLGTQSWNDDSIKCLQSGGFLHASGFLGLGHECLNAENFHVIGVVR